MAWPEALTANQQTAVESFSTSCRTWCAALAQLNILGAAIGAAWFGGINTLVGDLQSTDLVPNVSGLAGSQDLTATQVTNIALWANTLANPANSDQGTGSYASVGIVQTCIAAAGINASI